MKASLSHLPQSKQEQIAQVTEIIREVASPEKIILFGSYATGTWVEHRYFENGIHYEYISDYDFLVIVESNREKDYIIQDKIVNRCRSLISTPINPIIHTVEYVKEGLSIGQYFFSDIVKEGVLLFNSGHIEFEEPRELSEYERKLIAEGYFNEWFTSANEFFIDTKNAFNRGSFKNAAFYLHQATERFYNTVLLVFTGYKPKSHNLDKLRQYAKPLSEDLYIIFPSSTDSREEVHLFDLLKRGYIDARYKHDYIITKDELTTLIERVQKMEQVVQKICIDKISALI